MINELGIYVVKENIKIMFIKQIGIISNIYPF